MGCLAVLIAGANMPKRGGVEHAFSPCGAGPDRSWGLLWLVNSYIPMAGSIKSILNGVVVIAVVLWLLTIFGLMSEISKIGWGSSK